MLRRTEVSGTGNRAVACCLLVAWLRDGSPRASRNKQETSNQFSVSAEYRNTLRKGFVLECREHGGGDPSVLDANYPPN